MVTKRSGGNRQRDSLADQVVPALGGESPRVRVRRLRSMRFIPLMPSLKRIRRWRDKRMAALMHGGLLSYRRTSYACPHKSKQRRVLRHRG